MGSFEDGPSAFRDMPVDAVLAALGRRYHRHVGTRISLGNMARFADVLQAPNGPTRCSMARTPLGRGDTASVPCCAGKS